RAVERRAEDPGAPLVQVLLSSHSPVVLRGLEPNAAVFLTQVSRILPGRSRSWITQPRLIGVGERPSLAGQENLDPNERLISPAEIADFEVRRVLED
ncbi:MAG TPA: hypothetical protein VN408_35985, partial [Actinoplanes sp.]|nr:hypothetical protein [Actinoplanes sp.]